MAPWLPKFAIEAQNELYARSIPVILRLEWGQPNDSEKFRLLTGYPQYIGGGVPMFRRPYANDPILRPYFSLVQYAVTSKPNVHRTATQMETIHVC